MNITYGNSRLLAKDAANRFRWQHCSVDGRWSTERNAKIYENLLALGPDPDPTLIEKMLDEGADLSLTRRECSSCGEHVTEWVYVTVTTSDDQDDDIILCGECLSRATTTMVLGEVDLPRESPVEMEVVEIDRVGRTVTLTSSLEKKQ